MSWKRIKAVFFRYYYSMMKGPNQLSDLFYSPLVDILLWGLASLWIEKQNETADLSLILMTGLIFWQVSWRGSIDISFSLLQEFWHRNLVNFFSTSLKLREWVAGVLLLSFAKLIITILFGSSLVFLLYSVNVFSIGWVFIPYAFMLLLFGWSLGFFTAGLIMSWGHQVEIFVWMIAPLFAPFSCVFYPLSTLPDWAQYVALCLPSSYIFEGMRTSFYGQGFALAPFLASLGLNLFFLVSSVSFLKYCFEKSRSKGLARLE